MPSVFVVRVLRALLAIWFVLSIGEPSVVRICPMHATAAAELADADLGTISRASGAEEAAHHTGHHASHGAPMHSHSSQQHHHHCTCINSCVGSASSALLAATRVQVEAPAVVAVVDQATSPSDGPALDDPPHLLPPGTGPPRI